MSTRLQRSRRESQRYNRLHTKFLLTEHCWAICIFWEDSKNVKKLGASEKIPKSESSIHVETTFASSVSRVVCSDIGSDINLMPPSLFTELLGREAYMEVTTLAAPRKFGLAVSTSKDSSKLYVEYDRTVKINIDMHIWHGKSLRIRNTFWFVTIPEQFAEEPLFGLRLLEQLGLRTKEILEAACDKYGGEVDAEDFIPEHMNIGSSISRIMQRGIFHSNERVDFEDVPDESSDIQIDLGDDTPAEKRKALNQLLDNAKSCGMSENGLEGLQELVNEFDHVFRVRLGNGPPAKVEPMIVQMNSSAVPFKASTRRYKPDQYKFLETWTKKLEEFGFIRKNTTTSWASPPFVVPKPGSSKFRLTFEMRRVNSMTTPHVWPVGDIEMELNKIGGKKVFAVLDIVSVYWQLPLETRSQDMHSI